MPTAFEFTCRVASLMQSEFAVLGNSMECLDAAHLLNDLEAIAAFAPGIAPPSRCSASRTLTAIPLLMTGRFRLHRLRLMRAYLRSIRVDVRIQLTAQADQLALSGRWWTYVVIRRRQCWFEVKAALLMARGILFVFHVPLNFEPACDSMSRLLRTA